MTDLPPFPGFRKEAFDFMRALAANNRRDWFKPRKETFDDEVMWPMQCLMADAAREASRLGLPFTADPKRSIFRLYRDTRFSKNKQPYKTHVGAVFSRSGERNEEGVLYVHFEPGNSFLGAGFWHPEMPLLRAWRTRLAAAPADFLALVRDLEAKGLAPETTDALKRLPRGFEAPDDPKVAEMLRWKSFLVSRTFDDEALQSPAFTEAVVAMMRDARPLLEYGWSLKPATVS